MRFASIPTSLLCTSSSLLFLLLTLPSLIRSAATSSDKATHEGLRKLTAANFTLTDQGAWLIEFFSPNCIHCKRFGATWSELSQNKDYLRTQYPQAPFTLAQVDCLAQWDLCKEQGVTFLPRLTIYQDGKQNADEYKGDRNYPEISAYIDRFAKQYRESKGVKDVEIVAAAVNKVPVADGVVQASAASTTRAALEAVASANATPASEAVGSSNTTTTTTTTTTASSASITTVTPMIEQVLPSGPNPKGELISYGPTGPISTKEQLASWLSKSSGQGPTFVKFFAPWCPHCKAMAAAFKSLSQSLKGRVNALEIDCEANQALCSSYDIGGYPVLRLYVQGNAREYNGGRSHDAMLKWVLETVSSSGLKPVVTSTELAGLAKENQVMFLYLHSPGTPAEEIQAVERASEVLFGRQAPIYVSSEAELLARYESWLVQDKAVSVPAESGLLVFKQDSTTQPVAVLNPSTLRTSDGAGQAVYTEEAKSSIARFLSQEQYASVTELTAANFEQVVRNRQEALVLLAALSDIHHGSQQASTPAEGIALKDSEIAALRSTALAWRSQHALNAQRQVIFAWIDADRWKSPLKKLYGIDSRFAPKAVLVEGNKLQYYELDGLEQGVSGGYGQQWISESVFASVEKVVRGQGLAKSSTSFFRKSLSAGQNYMNTLVHGCLQHPLLAFAFVATVMSVLFYYLGKTRGGGGARDGLPFYSKVSTVKAD
ncbi:hypothetical protein NDA11_003728 [Ustilago hordei]|nr:hypothetical protein NDA12_000257 [Ustilago hordei]KAJ1593538.1 hypothetical protein NDA15_005369 [Ustilago hordei]KAJ1595595.1 hypothetical protein NDA11_003728 [Ustilago hordei]